MAGADVELTADLFDGETYTPARPAQRQFKPWHRPRKQFVRRDQWLKQARKILAARETEEPLRYLGLPGEDLIDLRYLHEQVCGSGTRKLVFLGFNTAVGDARVDLHVSLDEVLRLPNVDSRSEVIGDDFRVLARSKSLALKRAESLGPFDLVNLDLCDGLLIDAPDPSGATIYAAISRLFRIQGGMTSPWLFLLTCRIGSAHVNAEAAALLFEFWQSNFDNCDGFEASCTGHLCEGADSSFDHRTAGARPTFEVTVTAICMWIINLAASVGARASLNSSISYRVMPTAECDDLVSLALWIQPADAGVDDRSGLAASTPAMPDECEQARKVPKRVSKTVAADRLLEDDAELRESLVLDSVRMLSLARYDTEMYRSWLEG
jgi:hypothetical protein